MSAWSPGAAPGRERSVPADGRPEHTDRVPDAVGLRILGAVELAAPSGPLPLGAAKERCLLAALVVAAGAPVHRDRLVEALWDGGPPRSAAKALQNYVLRLRGALAPVTGVRIETVPTGYRLVTEPGAVDADLAARRIADGRAARAAGEPGVAAATLRAALALWRGPALREFADREFARAEAGRLDELYESAREDLVDAELARGRIRAALQELEPMVAARPLSERRGAQRMLALYRDGRAGEALTAYEGLRRTLRDELGVDPGPELRDLHVRILGHDPALAPRPPAPRSGLLGRDRELGLLRHHVAAATAGPGGVVTVVGEPGIGKSSLLRALVADTDALVLSGRCLEGDWHASHQPFAEAVAGYAATVGFDRLRDELGAGTATMAQLGTDLHDLADPGRARLAPEEERLRLLDVVAGFLLARSRERPVVLLLDDLHWIDAASLTMLRHVGQRAAGHRLVVVAAYRAQEAGHELVVTLGALRAATEVATVRLGGLPADAVAELAGTVVEGRLSASTVSVLAEETGGNPFLVREVARHLAESGALRTGPHGLETDALPGTVPDGVRQVVARRRSRLSGAADRFLDHASVFDGPFPFAPVAAASGLDETSALAALDEVMAAGLVEADPVPERYQFEHALIRHAVYGGLNPSRRLRLHRALAQALQAAFDTGARIAPAEVVAHYAASAVLPGAERGVGPALAAADLAEDAAAHPDAADLLATACALAAPDDPRLPALHRRRGLVSAWALRFDEAVAAAHDAADRTVAADGPHAGAAYLAEVAAALAGADSARHAWQLAEHGLRLAGERRDAAWAELTLHDLDRAEAADPGFPGLIQDVPRRREALEILLDAGADRDRVDLARFALAARYGRRDRIPAAAGDDPTVRLFLLGDAAGALPLCEDRAEAARRQGRLALEGYYRGAAARCRIALGDIPSGRDGIAREAGIAARMAGEPWGWQRIHAIGTTDALAHVTDAGWPEVITQLQEAFPGNAAGARLGASAAACEAKAQARLGRADRVATLLADAVPALCRAPVWAMNHLRTLCDSVEALWLVGDGSPWLEDLERVARDTVLPADFRFPCMDVRLALARLTALDGRPAEARRWFAMARDVLDEQRAAPLRAIADLDAAQAEFRAGDPDGLGGTWYRSALATFDRLGMDGWLRRAARVPVRAR